LVWQLKNHGLFDFEMDSPQRQWKSRWNEWKVFWWSQRCKNQSLTFSLILCSLRTKHWIETQD
jgi:hypothetical protein